MDYFHLFTIGFILLALELVIPGTFYFLWIAIGSLIVGSITFFFADLNFLSIAIIWSVISISGLYFTKKYISLNLDQDIGKRLNKYINHHYILKEPISNGKGRIKLGGSYWPVNGPDLPADSKIIIKKIENITFIVEEFKN